VLGGAASAFFFNLEPGDISYKDLGASLWIFRWLGPLLVPVLPAFVSVAPYLFLAVAVGGAGGIIYGAGRASAAKTMGTAEFRCPGCQKAFSITQSRRKFEIVCPACCAFISTDRSRSMVKRQCDYCRLAWFAPADGAAACPGCQYKPGAGQTACAKCKKSIPKSVLYCRECFAWLSLPEIYLGGFTTETKHYDVGRFSAGAARAYVNALEARISAFAQSLGEYAKQVAASGALPIENIGATLVEIESALHLLHKATLATQWLAAKNERLPAELVARLAAHAASIRDDLEKLRKAQNWREKNDEKFLPPVKAACATFAAAQKPA
jgi:hypothetical protein